MIPNMYNKTCFGSEILINLKISNEIISPLLNSNLLSVWELLTSKYSNHPDKSSRKSGISCTGEGVDWALLGDGLLLRLNAGLFICFEINFVFFARMKESNPCDPANASNDIVPFPSLSHSLFHFISSAALVYCTFNG